MLYTLAVLASGILWGTMGLFVRELNAAGLNSMHIVTARCFVTMVVVGIVILIKDKDAFKIKLKDWWVFFGSGVVSILVFTWCYFTTISLTSMSVACILLYTSPIFFMLISLVVFKEKLTVVKVIALILAFAGCTLVSGFGGQISGKGLIIGLVSGLGYAGYSIFTSLATKKGYKPFTVTFYTFVFASAGCLFIGDIPTIVTKLSVDPSLIINASLLGVVTAVFPYLLYSWGLTGMEASTASIIASIEPVAATALGAIFFHEPITFTTIGGMCFVLAAIVLLSGVKKRKTPKASINN